jgi:hypothetical protein
MSHIKCMRHLLQDILKVNDLEKSGEDRYSFARIALFASLLGYLTSAIVYLFVSLNPAYSINIQLVETILVSLQYPILIFSGYSFGGKSLKVLETILGKKEPKESKEQKPETPPSEAL